MYGREYRNTGFCNGNSHTISYYSIQFEVIVVVKLSTPSLRTVSSMALNSYIISRKTQKSI